MEHFKTDRLNSFFSIQENLDKFLAKENIRPEGDVSFADSLPLYFLLESLPEQVIIYDYYCGHSGGKTTALAVESKNVSSCLIPETILGHKLSTWNSRIKTIHGNNALKSVFNNHKTPVISLISIDFLEEIDPLKENPMIPNLENHSWIVVGSDHSILDTFNPNLIRNGYRIIRIKDILPGFTNSTLALICHHSSSLPYKIQDNLKHKQTKNVYISLIKSCIDHELCGNPDRLKKDINMIIANAIHQDNHEVENKSVIGKISNVLKNEGVFSLCKRATKKIYHRLPVLFRTAS